MFGKRSCLNTRICQGGFQSLSYALFTGDDTFIFFFFFFFPVNGDEPGSPCIPSVLEQQVDLHEKSLVRKQICLVCLKCTDLEPHAGMATSVAVVGGMGGVL